LAAVAAVGRMTMVMELTVTAVAAAQEWFKSLMLVLNEVLAVL
jgi:hypothetical protein